MGVKKMASSQQPAGEKVVSAGFRTVEASGGSLRVTIPAHIATACCISEGDGFRVAEHESRGVAFYPAGVPFGEVREYVGNVAVVGHNGSLKSVIKRPLPARIGVDAGDYIHFEYSTSRGVIYADIQR